MKKRVGMKSYWLIYSLLCGMALLGSCDDNSSEEFEESVPEMEAEQNQLFHARKELNFNDSLEVRVLSWGDEQNGNYLVLLADSVAQHYVGNSFYRDGTLHDAWVDDLDRDGWPEVGVVLRDKGGRQYGNLYLHEMLQDFSLSALSFPQFTEALGAEYGGDDSIYLEDGQIVREFRLLSQADAGSGDSLRRRIRYTLENDQLVVLESEDFEVPN